MVGGIAVGTRVRPLPRLELAVRLTLAFAIAYQVVQRFTYTGYGMSEYGRSLWYVTYEHGFVRRGLAGEALRTIIGGRPTIATIDLVQNVVAVVTLGAMVALVVVLARRRTTITYAVATALVVAPFAFDSVGGQRRPDLLAFLLLALVGLWAATRAVVPTRLALVAGALLAVCTLASEAAPLIVAPWLVLVVIAATRARSGPRARTGLLSLLSVGPSAVVLLVLAAHGAPTYEQVRALELDAPNIIEGHGSVFEFLGDTFATSFQRVLERSHPELSIVVGLALVALLLAVFRTSLPHLGSLARWLLPSRAERGTWLADHGFAHDCALRAGVRLAPLDHRHRVRRAARARGHRRDRRARALSITRARPLAPSASRPRHGVGTRDPRRGRGDVPARAPTVAELRQ